MMNCELLATCSALGYLEGDTYHKEPDCLGKHSSEESGGKCHCLRSGEFLRLCVRRTDGGGQLLRPEVTGGCFILSEESVKDLIRYLRHEDETRDVRQQLGAAQILQSDLLPILTQHRGDKPLFDAVIRFLPWPFDFCQLQHLLARKPNSFFLPCLPG